MTVQFSAKLKNVWVISFPTEHGIREEHFESVAELAEWCLKNLPEPEKEKP